MIVTGDFKINKIMSYSGMTVNERLVVSGLYKDFERAIKFKNKEKLIEILKKISMNQNDIDGYLKKYKMNN